MPPKIDSGDQFEPEAELVHVKWTGRSTNERKPEENVDAIIASWKNPVYKFQADPCYDITAISRFLK